MHLFVKPMIFMMYSPFRHSLI